MKYDQQCTKCMPIGTFKALCKIVDYMWEDEEKNYNENSSYYGDLVNEPKNHIFTEIKKVKKYISQFSDSKEIRF